MAAAFGAGAGLPPELPCPSSTDFAAFGWGLTGIGIGRFIADLASCSLDIAWYMSKPMKEMNL